MGKVTITVTPSDPAEAEERERQRERRRKRGPTKGTKYKGAIRGLSHNRNRIRLWRKVKVGDKCELFLEPENPADRNAILVQWRGSTLGHLNASKAKLIAPYMEGGARFDVTVVYSQPGIIWSDGREDHNWHEISVEMVAIVNDPKSRETNQQRISPEDKSEQEPVDIVSANFSVSPPPPARRPWWIRLFGRSLT